MSGHTPGPWHFGNSINAPGTLYIGHPANNLTLAHVHNFPDQMVANARLIAAAPELLALLLECKPHLESLEDSGPLHEGWQSEELIGLVERVRTAIARAEGGEG